MREDHLNLEESRLDECRIASSMSRIHFVADDEPVLYHSNLMEIEAIQAAREKGSAMFQDSRTEGED